MYYLKERCKDTKPFSNFQIYFSKCG